MKRGLFISVEGIDGAGKSTHISFIADSLRKCAKDVIVTREPGGTDLGEQIRTLLLHNNNKMHDITELCLMFASRQELINQVIAPNLARGICVITDRFIDASVAYQGYGRAIGEDKVKSIAALLEPQLVPDLTFLFDAKLDTALRRIAKRIIKKNKVPDRIETAGNEFFAATQQGYYALAQQEPGRIKLINTEQEVAVTQAQIAKYLDDLLEQHEKNHS